MTRDELIAALEAATGPDRGLDAEIAVATFSEVGIPGDLVYAKMPRNDDHCAPGTFWRKDRSGASLWNAATFTASLDSAMTLLRDGAAFSVSGWNGEPSRAVVTETKWREFGREYGRPSRMAWVHDRQAGDRRLEADAATPALALCIASLKALTPTINTREGE